MNYPFGASLPVIALYLMMEPCPISPYLGPSKTQVTPNTEPVWGQQQLIRRVMGSTWARYQTDFGTVLGRLPGTNQENTGHLLPAKSEDTTALAMATLVARNGNPRSLLNKKKKKDWKNVRSLWDQGEVPSKKGQKEAVGFNSGPTSLTLVGSVLWRSLLTLWL